MNKDTRFSIHSRWKSFQYAFEGLIEFVRTEHNAWLHFLATGVVIALAFIFGVTEMEAIALIVAVAFVWITEILNTALEKAMDFITKEYNENIKVIKDLSAGAVLVAAIAALLIGLIVFVPKIILR
jgi:diacylglycerol kinase (ATP)